MIFILRSINHKTFRTSEVQRLTTMCLRINGPAYFIEALITLFKTLLRIQLASLNRDKKKQFLKKSTYTSLLPPCCKGMILHYWPTLSRTLLFFPSPLFLTNFQNDRFHSNKDFYLGHSQEEGSELCCFESGQSSCLHGSRLERCTVVSHIKFHSQVSHRWEFATHPWHQRSNTSRSCDSIFTSTVTCTFNCTCITLQSVLFLFCSHVPTHQAAAARCKKKKERKTNERAKE